MIDNKRSNFNSQFLSLLGLEALFALTHLCRSPPVTSRYHVHLTVELPYALYFATPINPSIASSDIQ